METINYATDSTAKILNTRFLKARETAKNNLGLTLLSFQDIVCSKEPDFNNTVGLDKIRNAWYCKTPNLRCTEIIEKLTNA